MILTRKTGIHFSTGCRRRSSVSDFEILRHCPRVPAAREFWALATFL